MTIATYTLGPATRPNIHHDNGFLDRYSMRASTVGDRARFAEWATKLEARESIQHLPFVSDLSDGLAAYRHFLYGNGKSRTFSYDRYVSSDPSGRITLTNAIADARQGAEGLYFGNFAGKSPVHFQMTGSALAAGSTSSAFPYPQTENWQKAIGGHNLWISANVDVKTNQPVGLPRFSMSMTIHVEDRYNFNPGAQDIATGIPDSDNGVFEVTGLAFQYMNYATLDRNVEWTASSSHATSAQISSTTSGRQRQPGDNLRLRNRL